MSSKDWSGKRQSRRARDALDAIRAIGEYLRGVSYEKYAHTRMLQSAVERELLIISEACTKLRAIEIDENVGDDKTLEHRYEDTNWGAIRGLGNVIRHEYGRVEHGAIWATVTGDDLSKVRMAILGTFPSLA